MRKRSIPIRIALSCASVALGWLLVELGARVMLGAVAHPDERVLLFSSPSWVAVDGAVRYAPHATVRSVAIYGSRIEYDVTFRTNDLGLVDERDYGAASPAGSMDARRDARRYAFIGDSFTSGFHAGEPWLPRLEQMARRNGHDVVLYNLGVGGASLHQFPALLQSVDRQVEPDFDELVFVVIGDDLLREAWRPVETADGRLLVCPIASTDATCAQGDTRLLVFEDPSASAAELLERVRRSGVIEPPSGLVDWLRRRTFVGSRIAAHFESRARAALPELRIDFGGWLAGLARAYPGRRIRFLHIPEKHETLRGRYAIDLGSQVERAGFLYTPLLRECGFTREDYFEIDAHFDRQGYARLAECVGRVMGWL